MQPLGSLFSGWLTEPIGRKYGMMVVNVPHIAGWLVLYFATTIEAVFIAGAMLGWAVGFMETPTITYVGEIT